MQGNYKMAYFKLINFSFSKNREKTYEFYGSLKMGVGWGSFERKVFVTPLRLAG